MEDYPTHSHATGIGGPELAAEPAPASQKTLREKKTRPDPAAPPKQYNPYERTCTVWQRARWETQLRKHPKAPVEGNPGSS